VSLVQGDFVQGWREYEWRWRKPGFARPALPRPLWDGSPLAGRTLFLYAEQGLGDTLHLVRYAPLIKGDGGRVMVACQKLLVRLLGSCPGVDVVLEEGGPCPVYDVQAPLLSLPGILGTDLSNIPAD